MNSQGCFCAVLVVLRVYGVIASTLPPELTMPSITTTTAPPDTTPTMPSITTTTMPSITTTTAQPDTTPTMPSITTTTAQPDTTPTMPSVTTTTMPSITTTTAPPDTTPTMPSITTTTAQPDTTTTMPSITTTTAPPDTTTTMPSITTMTAPPDTTTTMPSVTTMTAPPDTTTTTVAPPITTTAAGGCDTSIVLIADTPQTWETPNYPNNYDSSTTCSITISGPVNYAITMTFVAFSLESATYCNYDSLKVYDGSSNSTGLLGQYCGITYPASVSSSSNNMYLYFSTDYSVVSSGINAVLVLFDVSYPNCKSSYTLYTADNTVRTFSSSTDTYGKYPSNTDEYFLVVSSDNSKNVILELSAMSVESGNNCGYDRIVIYNGGCTTFSVLATHCGTYKSRWELTGTEFLVHFHSDGSVQKTGFTMEYSLGIAGTGSPSTTTTTAGAPLTEAVGLMNNVLTNYTAVNSPRRDFSTAISSTVALSLVGINGLDENTQTFTTTVAFDITWKDDYMVWPGDKAAGITSLLIPQDDVWKPDISLMNGVEKISQMGASFMFVQVQNNGTCRWKPYQILKSVCNTAMSKYPYDVQKCNLKFSTWSSSGSDVATLIGPEGMVKHSDFVENSEWTFLDITQSTETIDGKAIAVFTISIQRNAAFVNFYIAIPVVMLSCLNVFTFALPITSGEKSGFGMTVFLSFVVYLIVTFQKLPENSDELSLFAMYLLINSFLSALTVMISCLEIRMVILKTKHRPLGACARSFSSFIMKLQMKMLSLASKVENIEDSKEETQSDEEIDEDDEEAWPNFVSALDFVCFFVFACITVFIIIFFMVYLSL